LPPSALPVLDEWRKDGGGRLEYEEEAEECVCSLEMRIIQLLTRIGAQVSSSLRSVPWLWDADTQSQATGSKRGSGRRIMEGRLGYFRILQRLPFKLRAQESFPMLASAGSCLEGHVHLEADHPQQLSCEIAVQVCGSLLGLQTHARED
jgi:hypothetical protein